eukprot:gene1877-biopygen10409
MDFNITDDVNEQVCEGCLMGKQHRNPFPKESFNRASEVLATIHSDVCGPINVESLGKSRNFVAFIDDASRYTHVYFIQHKREVLDKFKEFVNLTTNQTGKKVKKLRTDNGGEFCSKEFAKYLKERGIVHQTTTPMNPEQSGVAERMNRIIVETARSMLHHASLPTSFWAEAVSTAVFLRNRSPKVTVNKKTPFEFWYNAKPNVSNLKVFGCIAYVHVADKNRHKFDAKSKQVVFAGYPDGIKGYKLYDLNTKSFIRSRDVKFLESTFSNNGMFAFEKRIKDVDLYTEKPTITDDVYFDGSNAEINNEEHMAIERMLREKMKQNLFHGDHSVKELLLIALE